MAPMIEPGHDALYHWSGSALEFFVPPIVDFCVFWLALTVLLTIARGRARIAIWSGILGLIPWIMLKNWGSLTGAKPPHWLSLSLFGLGLMAMLFPLVLWRPSVQRSEGATRLASTLLAFSAASGGAVLLASAWDGWEARSLNTGSIRHHRPVIAPELAKRPRVIWILLDELSFQQVYERRFPGLRLPSFDALAEEATVFTHAVPVGIRTEVVMPSLIMGDEVDDIRSTPDGRLSVHAPDTGTWQQFDEYGTIFQDALNMKYSTAVAGWYNPYCRILPDVLTRCFWSFDAPTQNIMLPQATFGLNVTMPWMRVFMKGAAYRFASHFLSVPEIDELNAKEHILDYVALANASDRILDDRSLGFALIHMPVPHPGGIYDPDTGALVVRHSNYLDNLALADKFLGHVRSRLIKSGQWDGTTIVIMGDHSWRTKPMWGKMPGWTKEEQAASNGDQFDDRPGYIVKLAGQRLGARVDTPFEAKNTRKLLDALLAGRIRSKEDLSMWAMQAMR
jgi:hypothetical protein